MNKLYKTYKDKKFEILAISLDSDKDDLAKFIEKKEIKYRVLLDTDGETGTNYKVEYIPLSVLVDVNGKVVHNDNSLPSEELLDKCLGEL